ncbi:predicted protein [Postia placenta Mad-698-R]|uniref:Autophagy-related protein 17 n=1 Tax=Rhodonia placenta TaxID=104341 RepID=A0A8H7U377_9APHY|nr:predicted protein [Postia placenta Mad-698-R]KAF9815616.1 hypothetical protein IEO21_04476 [Postia placenta]
MDVCVCTPQEWDTIRSQRADALDASLESLGAQPVPPVFHTTAAPDPSPFGIQNDSDSERDPDDIPIFGEQLHAPSQSPTDTLRNITRSVRLNVNGVPRDRSTWKTLRDFVDERTIEDVLDTIESDRNALDDILARTSDYPESLSNTIAAIEGSVPAENTLPSMQDIFQAQGIASTDMASHLESLAAHFEQMSTALEHHEAGETFVHEDLHDWGTTWAEMNRDTEELPAILSEMEERLVSIDAAQWVPVLSQSRELSNVNRHSTKLVATKRTAQQNLDAHRRILDDLDELGEIMSEMLERQQAVEDEAREHVALLHHHIVTIEDLQHRFTSYQYAYSKLLLELARRRQYRDASDRIVNGMIAQLNAMTEGTFSSPQSQASTHEPEHGQYLPEDVCLFVQNAPTRWNVVPHNQELEVLPEIDSDLLDDARLRVGTGVAALGASQSL